jgi:hypothetical protein
MPCWWQSERGIHKQIRQAPVGPAIAALKLYIAFCIKANYNAQKGLAPGCVKLPLARLARLVGLSKPMVIAGLRELLIWNLIERVQYRPAIYQISEYERCHYWTKIPSAHLYGGREGIGLLRRMNNRGTRRLLALEMYLYLASIRNRQSLKARVSYDRLCELLGVGRNEVSAAISMLIEDDLISARHADANDTKNLVRPSNEYWLRGTKPLHNADLSTA